MNWDITSVCMYSLNLKVCNFCLQEAKLLAIVDTTATANAVRQAQRVQLELKGLKQKSLKEKLAEVHLEGLEEQLKQELGVPLSLLLCLPICACF
jgi:hypothetical protein